MPHISLKTIRKTSSGVTTLADVDSWMRTTLDSLISEINLAFQDVGDLAEVEEVFTDVYDVPPDNEEIPRYDLVGAIRFKKLTTSTNTSNVGIARPFNPNLKEIPVEGEYVTIRYMFGEYFYSERVNIFYNPNNASFPDLASKYTRVNNIKIKSDKIVETSESGMVENVSTNEEEYLGKYFKPNFLYKQLLPHEGDVLIEGRFGNSIRIGSNEKRNKENSPNIKLRAGQLKDASKFKNMEIIDEMVTNARKEVPVVEDINSDGSSMWMTTDETVSLTPATLEDPNIYPTSVAPEEFGGKQIILNSGRLIFNSKENGILGFSNGPIDLSTLDVFSVSAKLRLDLYSPTVTVGRRDKTKNINLNTSNVTVRGDSGKTLVRANKIRLLGPVEGEDIRRAGKLQPVVRPVTNEFGTKGKEAASFIVAPGGKDIQVTPAVKGDELKEVLKEMLEMQKVTTKAVQDIDAKVLTPLLTAITPLVAGATAAPLQAVAKSLANITMNVISDINTKIETLPKILSKVVEIE